MAKLMKDMARPYAGLFSIALVIALLGRIGLWVMDMTGTIAYDYISASGVALLDVVCSILTGSAFIAFVFAGSLALVLSTARGRLVRVPDAQRRHSGQACHGFSVGVGNRLRRVRLPDDRGKRHSERRAGCLDELEDAEPSGYGCGHYRVCGVHRHAACGQPRWPCMPASCAQGRRAL